MMRLTIRRILTVLIPLALLAACGQTPDSSAPTVDTEAIAATVSAQLLAEEATAVAGAGAAAAAASPTVTSSPTPESTAVTPSSPTPLPVNNSDLAVATEDLQTSLIDVYQRANPAVVYVIVPPLGSGSGFVYGEEGYIVTNNHVIAGGQTYETVTWSSRQRWDRRWI